MHPHAFKPFPATFVAATGGGGTVDEDGRLPFALPQALAGFVAPGLQSPQALATHRGVVEALERTLAALRHPGSADAPQIVDLAALDDDARRLLDQVLGDGEIAADVLGDVGAQVRESMFAGVWRVAHRHGGLTVRDTIDIGTVPQVLVDAAREDGFRPRRPFADPPPDAVHAPALLAGIEERQRRWHAGQPALVVNLTLLPLSVGDRAHLDAQLGDGRVRAVSRGPGRCRMANTCLPRTWRVTYVDPAGRPLLDTLEIGRIPERMCATADDLADSAERLAEVTDWVHAA
jgi:hydrogenase-1 operon protein HyaF